MFRFLSEFHISLVKQNHEVTKSKEIRAAAVFKGCVENHGPVERQSFFFWFPVFRPRPRSMFRTPGPAVVFMKRYRSKKKRVAHHGIKAVPSHTGESESQVRQGLAKKFCNVIVVVEYGIILLFFQRKQGPFISEFLQGFSCLLFVRLVFIYPKKCSDKYLQQTHLKSYQNPIGGLSSNHHFSGASC